jgi:fibronectin type 3 domain-containing protein
LNPTLAITLDVIFDPTAAGAASGQLTINNASTGASSAVALTGTGAGGSAPTPHQVSLTWDAPTSSPDPVAGYNIYRSSSGSTSYQLLNASIDTQTTYVDTNVQESATYIYYVMSVDSSGLQSTSSNQVTATIP